MADKKAQLPGEPVVGLHITWSDYIGTGEYVKRLSQEKVANKLKSDERKSGQGYFKFKDGGFAPNTEYTVVLLMVRLMI
jgi:hypothetical protein